MLIYLSSSTSKSFNLTNQFFGYIIFCVKDCISVFTVFLLNFDIIGDIPLNKKCNLGNGTKFVSNSFKSPFKSASNLNG